MQILQVAMICHDCFLASLLCVQSVFGIARTLFLVVLLALGSSFIHADMKRLVLQPVERMVTRVKEMAEDPLGQATLNRNKKQQEQQQFMSSADGAVSTDGSGGRFSVKGAVTFNGRKSEASIAGSTLGLGMRLGGAEGMGAVGGKAHQQQLVLVHAEAAGGSDGGATEAGGWVAVKATRLAAWAARVRQSRAWMVVAPTLKKVGVSLLHTQEQAKLPLRVILH